MELIVVQDELVSQIHKLKVNFKKCARERVTRQYIETRLQALESKYKDITKNHVELIKNRGSITTTYFSDDVFGNVEELFLEFKTELKEKLEKFIHNQKDSSFRSTAGEIKNIKLPTITLPIFSGKYVEWPSFHDLFDSLIHQNLSLSDVERLHYLKTHISHEAEQLLRHIPITAANYESCWQLLKQRFNNKRYIANTILTRLTGLKACATESSSAVKLLLDTTSDCLNALSNIGVDVSSWDIIIIYLTVQKLDTESRKQWEQKISDHSDVLPTLKEFKSFLESRFRSLEFLEPVKRENSKEKIERAKVFTVIATLCPFCSENHLLYQCKEFCRKGYVARREFVEKKRLCFNCFGDNHPVYRCKRNTACLRCGRRHHSLLHPEGVNSSPITKGQSTSSEQRSVALNSVSSVSKPISIEPVNVTNIATHLANSSYFSNGHVMLATALVKINCCRNSYTLRALLDQGSQASFISEYAVQLLGLRKEPVKALVSGLGGDQLSMEIKYMVSFKIQSIYNSSCCNVQAYVLTKLSSTLPSRHIEVTDWPELLHLPLADPGYGKPQGVDLLLGAEIYGQILVDGLIKNKQSTLTAQNTVFGWILSGRVMINQDDNYCYNNNISLHIQDESVNTLLRSFWELETDTQKELLSKDDEKCEAYYSSTTIRDDSGRYCVKLPFKNADPVSQYGQFKPIAERRLKALEKKLERNHFLREEYTKAIKDYINTNHMELITNKEEIEKENCVYLPHHAVIRNDKLTTKVRIVFDASCKGVAGRSLNDDLLVGPRLQPELRHLIQRWRTHPICFTVDIIKMYRQILVDKGDTDFQRLLWRENTNKEIGVYRMLRVTFGVASAPYLAVKTLQQIAKDDGHAFPLAANIVAKDFYMDDCLSGCNNEEEAIEIYHQMVALLRKGGFELQKWMSNSSKLMELIQNKSDSSKCFSTNDEVVKILGLSWNANRDVFQYTVNLPKQTKTITKRIILSDISRLFDPLGWIAPVVIQAKIFMQKLWLKGLSWDEEVTLSLLEEWNKYRRNLPLLNNFEILRWVGLRNSARAELHGFCDASNSAYAAVTYLRVIDEDGVHVALVSARTKVAPVQQVSTPRLELCGAVLLSKLLSEVSTVLNIPQSNLYAWTDSTIVLAWLKGEPTRWKTFVANRVTEIINVLNNEQWRHVQSADNPADMASRGLTPEEFLSRQQFWKYGPRWLSKDNIPVFSDVNLKTHLEENQVKSHMATVEANESLTVYNKYSSLKRLIRVVAYCKRFIEKLKHKNTQFLAYLTAKELEKALILCIKHCQIRVFQEEIAQLHKNKSVKRNSNTFSLCPFLDMDGVMRVKGRIQHSMEEYDTKHPIILPYGHHISRLIVANAHEETLHGGPQLTLNYIRSRYWIINAKGLVRQHIKRCLKCTRYSTSQTNPFMGNLPSSRVTISHPFSRSGVDYAGPVNIRMSKGRGCKSYKGYICLFICMTTKAIHLEAVTDLTSEAFLAAFKRFVARRGHCKEVWSDNGTNFVGAAKELQKMFRADADAVMNEVAASLANQGTEWHYICPRAPNFGGLWEAGVRSTKYHLKRVLDGSTLTYEELSTVLTQIEACLNSRPLYRLPSQQDESSPLTPGHFLIGEPLLTVPDYKYEDCQVSNLRRWQIVQQMVQQFWRKWSQEYLCTLHNRYKWTKINPEPNIGDIVLVKEDDLPPSKWLFGRIETKHPGSDNITRVVTLKCKGSTFKRPVSKLCILPVTE